ncbi:MAG: RNA polymerase sigma factor, partial [Planctomycetaceae bacterium]|nr:RNA polymerase sigma factor [Planctomycetaceae bacterium]
IPPTSSRFRLGFWQVSSLNAQGQENRFEVAQSRGEMEADEEIVARWMAGRQTTDLELLVRRYGSRFLRSAQAMLGNTVEAEDVSQEALLRMVRALPKFQGRSSFGTWSFTILLNTVRSSLQRQQAPGQQTVSESIVTEVPVDAPVDRSLLALELRSIMAEAVDQLPPKQKVAIVLVELEGFSVAEAAQIEQCSPKAMQQRLIDARSSLRRHTGLKRHWNGE